jgi:hypothetical protein
MWKTLVSVSVLALIGSSVAAQAPQSESAPTSEQIAIQKVMLAKDAELGRYLSLYSQCQGDMLDLAKLKARVAQLEALEKKPDVKPAEPVKPKD